MLFSFRFIWTLIRVQNITEMKVGNQRFKEAIAMTRTSVLHTSTYCLTFKLL